MLINEIDHFAQLRRAIVFADLTANPHSDPPGWVGLYFDLELLRAMLRVKLRIAGIKIWIVKLGLQPREPQSQSRFGARICRKSRGR